jgi:hypothetical protein
MTRGENRGKARGTSFFFDPQDRKRRMSPLLSPLVRQVGTMVKQAMLRLFIAGSMTGVIVQRG